MRAIILYNVPYDSGSNEVLKAQELFNIQTVRGEPIHISFRLYSSINYIKFTDLINYDLV